MGSAVSTTASSSTVAITTTTILSSTSSTILTTTSTILPTTTSTIVPTTSSTTVPTTTSTTAKTTSSTTTKTKKTTTKTTSTTSTTSSITSTSTSTTPTPTLTSSTSICAAAPLAASPTAGSSAVQYLYFTGYGNVSTPLDTSTPPSGSSPLTIAVDGTLDVSSAAAACANDAAGRSWQSFDLHWNLTARTWSCKEFYGQGLAPSYGSGQTDPAVGCVYGYTLT